MSCRQDDGVQAATKGVGCLGVGVRRLYSTVCMRMCVVLFESLLLYSRDMMRWFFPTQKHNLFRSGDHRRHQAGASLDAAA